MGLELATAYVTARGDTSKVPSDLRSGEGAITTAAQGLQAKINRILAMVGIGLSIGKIISDMREGIALAERQIDAEQRVAAVVKGTGMAAGFTADELKRMAGEMQAATTHGDEAILESMAKMLTFKSVVKDTFQMAIEIALDTADVMGTDARGAVLMLGRALEDPVRGVSALRRTGVSFSEQQKIYIKQLVESNRLNDAQAYILETVRGQMGEVAKEMAKTDAGKLKQLKNTLGDVKEELGKVAIKAQIFFTELQIRVTESFVKIVEVVGDFIQQNWDMIKALGRVGIVLIGVIGAVQAYGLALKIAAAAKAFLLALAGPKGWVLLAAGVIAATATVSAMNSQFKELNETVGETKEDVEGATDAIIGMGDAAEEKLGQAIGTVDRLRDALQRVLKLDPHSYTMLRGLMQSKDTLEENIKYMKDMIAQARFAEQGGMERDTGMQVRVDYMRQRLEGMEEERENLKAIEEEYGDLGAAAQHLATILEQGQSPREKLMAVEERINLLLQAGLITAGQAAKARRQAWEGSPVSQGVKKAQAEMERKRSELEQIGKRWAEQVRTPMEKFQEEMQELQAVRDRGFISEENLERAREILTERLEEEERRRRGPEPEFGRTGFGDFGRQLQDMMLRQSDPQIRTAANTQAIADNTARIPEMVDAMADGNTSTATTHAP